MRVANFASDQMPKAEAEGFPLSRFARGGHRVAEVPHGIPEPYNAAKSTSEVSVRDKPIPHDKSETQA